MDWTGTECRARPAWIPGSRLSTTAVWPMPGKGADWGQQWSAVYNVTRGEAIRILRQCNLIPPKPAKGADVLSPASHEILKKFWDNRTTTAYGHSLKNLAGDGKFPIVLIAEMPATIKAGYYVLTTGWHDTSKGRLGPASLSRRQHGSRTRWCPPCMESAWATSVW